MQSVIRDGLPQEGRGSAYPPVVGTVLLCKFSEAL